MKLTKQVIFTIIVGVMMVTWAAGIALSSNLQLSTPQGFRIESVYTRPLTSQEKITILRYGRVLIEYMHTGGNESTEKRATYENFVARFKDFAVLEVVEISEANQTLDQFISPTGDIVPLENVSASELIDVFCEKSLMQPKECLLRNI